MNVEPVNVTEGHVGKILYLAPEKLRVEEIGDPEFSTAVLILRGIAGQNDGVLRFCRAKVDSDNEPRLLIGHTSQPVTPDSPPLYETQEESVQAAVDNAWMRIGGEIDQARKVAQLMDARAEECERVLTEAFGPPSPPDEPETSVGTEPSGSQGPGRAEADISEEAIKWLQDQFAKAELVPVPQEIRSATPPITRHDLFMAATIAGLRANPKWDGSGSDEIRQISIMAKAQADDAVGECDEYSEEEIRRMMEAADPTAWRPAPSPNPLNDSGRPYPRNLGGDPDWS